MFSANSQHHSKLTERFSVEFILKAYGCIVLMEINGVLCVAFSFYHLAFCFLTAISKSTELWLLKHYTKEKKKKKEVKGFHLSRKKVRGIYFCDRNEWRMQTM